LFETPYLEAQVNMPLFGLLGGLIFLSQRVRVLHFFKLNKARRGILVWCVVLVFFYSVFVVNPSLLSAIPFARYLQYSYRLISYVNMSVVMTLFVFFKIMGKKLTKVSHTSIDIVIAGCLTLGFVNVGIKAQHGQIMMRSRNTTQVVLGNFGFQNVATQRNPLLMPDTFNYSCTAYTFPPKLDPRQIANLNSTMNSTMNSMSLGFPIQDGREFGETGDLNFTLLEPGPSKFRVHAFPWNILVVDGKRIITSDLSFDTNHVYLPLEAGSHSVQYEFCPDLMYRVLSVVSATLLLIWSSAIFGVMGFQGWRRIRSFL